MAKVKAFLSRNGVILMIGAGTLLMILPELASLALQVAS